MDCATRVRDADDFFFREAVQKLAHPYSVKTVGKGVPIQQIGAVTVYAFTTGQTGRLLSHHFQLLRQVHDGYSTSLLYCTHCGPSAGIPANIEQAFRVMAEHDFQRFAE